MRETKKSSTDYPRPRPKGCGKIRYFGAHISTRQGIFPVAVPPGSNLPKSSIQLISVSQFTDSLKSSVQVTCILKKAFGKRAVLADVAWSLQAQGLREPGRSWTVLQTTVAPKKKATRFCGCGRPTYYLKPQVMWLPPKPPEGEERGGGADGRLAWLALGVNQPRAAGVTKPLTSRVDLSNVTVTISRIADSPAAG